MRNKLLILPFVTLFILSGCAMVPPTLQVDDGTPLINFADAKSQLNVNVGLQARWGGVIAKVKNLKGRTMVEVVNFKLSSRARPLPTNETLGRFRFYYQGLLDPVIYKQGKSVTVVGTIAEAEQGKIGEQDYLYPVLNAKKVHLWKDIKRIDMQITQQPLWYSPYSWAYPYYEQRSVIIQRSSNNKKSTKSAPTKH